LLVTTKDDDAKLNIDPLIKTSGLMYVVTQKRNVLCEFINHHICFLLETVL